MWRQRKLWEGPNHPWQKERIKFEKELMRTYGLKNKKELWKAATLARKIRKYVRYLNAKKAAGFDIKEEESKILNKLIKLGLLSENDTLDKALDITVKDVLERRLQTIVWRKGLARTVKQARQFIVHGHISVNDKVITSPGYLVKKYEEENIKINEFSPLNKKDHPIWIDAQQKEGQNTDEGDNQEEKKEE